MTQFALLPERHAHLLRMVLLAGWVALICSLMFEWDPYPFNVNHCGNDVDCHSHEGNQIFWGIVVPSGLLIIVVLSHEIWRRICPLAFVSQLFRALGWQRTVPGKGGRREGVKISADSWLGRHHVQLQWFLLIAGFCLRILVVNSSTHGLGILLIITILAALVVGWAYSGKAWCQYFCPMAPVQTVLTGPRSFFGSTAHTGTTSRITQSMCRTVATDGTTVSACVACQAPCMDIDSERAYWQTLSGKRGLAWAWYSYPGLVIAFFLLIKDQSRGGLDYLRSGMWAYDEGMIYRLLEPFGDGIWTFWLPRLITVPFLLIGSGWISFWLFSRIQTVQTRRMEAELPTLAVEMSINRTRLLASFVAVNSFFWFADISLGMLGPAAGQGIRSIVLIVSGMALHRGWHREKGAYTRESTSASLRKQLKKQLPDLSTHLGGRTLEELSAGEVFTLAKILPIKISETKRTIYKNVMVDMLSTGRLDRATSLIQLEELRKSLALVEEDHFTAIREIAMQDPQILELNTLQREIRNLRQESAREAIEELIHMTQTPDLTAALLLPHFRERLEQIQLESDLDDDDWRELLGDFGPSSIYARQRLEGELDRLRQQLAARRSLELAGRTDRRLKPLLPICDRRISSLAVIIDPMVDCLDSADPLRQQLVELQMHFPPSVWRVVRSRDHQSLVESGSDCFDNLIPAELGPLPDCADVLDGLWKDPDPDTALWALWVQQRRSGTRAEALRRQPRVGLPSSPGLDRLLAGHPIPGAELMGQLLQLPLVAELTPAALFSLIRFGEVRSWQPHQTLFKVGDPPDMVAILLAGDCGVWRSGEEYSSIQPFTTLSTGQPIGEVSYLADQPRKVHIRAGSTPVHALVFSSANFELLLQQSPDFSRGLLHQLAMKVQEIYSKQAAVRHLVDGQIEAALAG